jgi:uncharacterized protein (DUF697 family)
MTPNQRSQRKVNIATALMLITLIVVTLFTQGYTTAYGKKLMQSLNDSIHSTNTNQVDNGKVQ